MLANYGLIQISRTNAAARQSSPDAAFDPFFQLRGEVFQKRFGKQIAMYRRICSKRKHGAFCIEILQRFQGNRNCSIFAFTDQHVFLEGVSCHNVNFLVLCHQRPIEEAKKGNCPSKFLRTRYSLQHASKASEANSKKNGATACSHTVAAAETVGISVLCEAINRNQNLRKRSEILSSPRAALPCILVEVRAGYSRSTSPMSGSILRYAVSFVGATKLF